MPVLPIFLFFPTLEMLTVKSKTGKSFRLIRILITFSHMLFLLWYTVFAFLDCLCFRIMSLLSYNVFGFIYCFYFHISSLYSYAVFEFICFLCFDILSLHSYMLFTFRYCLCIYSSMLSLLPVFLAPPNFRVFHRIWWISENRWIRTLFASKRCLCFHMLSLLSYIYCLWIYMLSLFSYVISTFICCLCFHILSLLESPC